MKSPFTYVTKLMLAKLRTAQRGQTHDDDSITYLCTSYSELGKGVGPFHHRTGSNNLHSTKFTAYVYVALYYKGMKKI